MAPGPLLASPPETDQMTGAGPPAASEAVNCWTDVPCLLVALHPVQLVSIVLVPGERLKVELEGSAVTAPPAQPATASSTGGKSIAASRRGSFRVRAHVSPGLRAVRAAPAAICRRCGKIPVLSSIPAAITRVPMIQGLLQSIRHRQSPKRTSGHCPAVTARAVRL